MYLLVGGTVTDDVWWGSSQLFGGPAKERGTWYGGHTSTWTTNLQSLVWSLWSSPDNHDQSLPEHHPETHDWHIQSQHLHCTRQ